MRMSTSDGRGGLRARTFVASGLLALLVGGTFAALLLSIDQLRTSSDLDRHTQEVLATSNRLERLVVDLETGLRGFAITREERFLEPWEQARLAVPEQVRMLQQLVADNGEQRARAGLIGQASTAYVEDYSPRVIESVRRSTPDLVELIHEGKRRLDAMRADFDAFITTERELSMVRHEASVAASRTAAIAAVIGILASLVLIVAFATYLGRVIVRPVRSMANAAGRIAAGDLTARASDVGVAEIGTLGRSFNAMAASVERTQAELARVAEEQSALRRVATLVARGVAPADVFAAVTEEVGVLLDADLAHMARFETDGTASGIAGWSPGAEGVPIGRHVSLQGESATASVLRTGRAARTDRYEDAAGPIAEALRSLGVRSSVGAPIIVDGCLWGAVIASSKRERPFPSGTEERLTAFTELVGTAISNAYASAELTASRARIVAAADDARRRIERDLHDGIQQRIVSLGLELRAAELAAQPEMPDLQKQVSDAADGLETVLEELREISRGIHPAILSEGGLGPALRALGRRSPIPVDLDVRDDARLPKHVEVTAYYVASEALANAAKHADASRVEIDLRHDVGLVRLSIRDDGVGGAEPTGGSGLVGLRDRAEALGGTMVVSSPVGGGTSITVDLPVAEPSGANEP